MLTFFDWLRQCRTGGELLALLSGAVAEERLPGGRKYEPPPPETLFRTPCRRCGFFSAVPGSAPPDCPTCEEIRRTGKRMDRTAGFSRILWGHVNRIPRMIAGDGHASPELLGRYIHDDHHFLAMFSGKGTLPFFRRMLMYDGHDLKGFLQIFPAVSAGHRNRMMDLLIRACHYDAVYPMDALRVRCFTRAHQVFHPGRYETPENRITCEASEFMSLLEMARIFRNLLTPVEQKMLGEYADAPEDRGAGDAFLWGRMMGALSPAARDMLVAWDFRNWPAERARYFFDMFAYVDYAA
jgi:hypothetical protein